jgi:hypothetical protein
MANKTRELQYELYNVRGGSARSLWKHLNKKLAYSDVVELGVRFCEGPQQELVGTRSPHFLHKRMNPRSNVVVIIPDRSNLFTFAFQLFVL